MQLTAKLKNKSTAWAANQRPRVGDVVTDGTIFYENISGYNDVLTNTDVWFPISSSSSAVTIPEIDKNASNISGTDPFWVINLSGESTIPAFPRTFTVYIDQNGTGDFVLISPVSYDAQNKILSNMSSPTDYPSQQIKIFVS